VAVIYLFIASFIALVFTVLIMLLYYVISLIFNIPTEEGKVMPKRFGFNVKLY